MEKADYDLIVVGAGPAGAACAITAARSGASVLLLEKARFPRHKVCGEFISPESLHLLQWLLGERLADQGPQIPTARVFSGKNCGILPIHPAARSIPRFDLDATMLQAARQAGVDAREAAGVNKVEDGPVFSVKTGEAAFTGRSVVNATGRWSQLTQPTEGKNGYKWIGVKGHFEEADPSLSVDLYLFDGGYCGVQPIHGTAINACAMVRADVARSLDEVFSRNERLFLRSRNWKPLSAPITTASLYFHPPQTESNGMLLAGDSASFIDPFAGDGISLALHSGALAAQCLLPFLQRNLSLEQARAEYRTAYMQQFAPAFRNAARVRLLLSAPPALRSLLVRWAGLAPFARSLVRGTRTKGFQPRISQMNLDKI